MNNDLAWLALMLTVPTATVALVGQQFDMLLGGWPAVGLTGTLAFIVWFIAWASSGGLHGIRPGGRGQR
jgi:hypothetical protein